MIGGNCCFGVILAINPVEVRKMSDYQNYVFVLWGEQFDELAAVVFVTELRDIGLCVKIVGLTLRRINIMPPQIWTEKKVMLSSYKSDEKKIYPPIQSKSCPRNLA